MGILQYGMFHTSSGTHPYQLLVSDLISYPFLLNDCAELVTQHIVRADGARLCCQTAALPLATLVSQKTGIPLVWEQGTFAAAVEDFAGAYDIGHPTTFLSYVLPDREKKETIVRRAQSVGMMIEHYIALFGHEGALLSIEQMTVALAEAGLVSARQLDTIRKEVRKERPQ